MRKVLWLAVFLLVLAPVGAWGVNIDVPAGGSIQAAINAAVAGDVIRVEGNWTYKENLTIDSLNGLLFIIGGYAPGFGSQDPVAFPTTIDPARDGYNLEIFGSPGVTPIVSLISLIFTNSHRSTNNNFTGAVYAEADGGDVVFGVGGCTFEKFFTGHSPGVMVFNALGTSSIAAYLYDNTIAHNFGFEDNIVFFADGPITASFGSNYIFDNHFDGSPGLSFFTDFGGSFIVNSDNNFIANNNSLKGTGGALNIVANTGENRLISVNDTIYKNSAIRGGGAYIASYQTSHTLVSFTNTILNVNSAAKYSNVFLSGNADFGAAFCSLGSADRVYHHGTYNTGNILLADPKVLEYILGKPYLAFDSNAINGGVAVGSVIGTHNIIAGSKTVLTDTTKAFTANSLKGRIIQVTQLLAPFQTNYRIIASNTATTITFDNALDFTLATGDTYSITGAPGVDILGRLRPQGAAPDKGCWEALTLAAGTGIDISGKLTDLYSGMVLTAGTVFLEALNGLGEVITIKSTLMNSLGVYRFANLPAGTYRITPRVLGYDFPSQQVTVAVDTTLNFQGNTLAVVGRVVDAGSNAAISSATTFLTIDDWQITKTGFGGDYGFNVAPGNYLVFLRKVIKFYGEIVSEYRFYPSTAESFSAGINGIATGGSAVTVVDTAMPWGSFNVDNKLIVVTHANGTKEIRTITTKVGATLNISPALTAGAAAGDRYTIDTHGFVSAATGAGTKTTLIDSTAPWADPAKIFRAVNKRIIIFSGGTVNYKVVSTANTTTNTLTWAGQLAANTAPGDRYAILTDTFVGTATGGSVNTIEDGTIPWGNTYLVGRPIAINRNTALGVVREVKTITAVDQVTGTITVDVDDNFNVAPVAGNTYEIDLLNYDFVGEQVAN